MTDLLLLRERISVILPLTSPTGTSGLVTVTENKYHIDNSVSGSERKDYFWDNKNNQHHVTNSGWTRIKSVS